MTWIKVKEKLPDDLENVVFCEKGDPLLSNLHIGWFIMRDSGNLFVSREATYMQTDIEYWLRIPEVRK